MSLIEQAAKRLEQLRSAGVRIPDGNASPGADAPSSGSQVDAVPLRVVKELEAKAPAVQQHSVLAAAIGDASRESGAAPREPERAGLEAQIDLARLSAAGYITPHAPRSRLAEEFRVIKRPLMNNVSAKSAARVHHANRIMVTSAMPGEGKTFVSVNLAMSLAMELDTEILLVDADASRPALLERLGLEPAKGLLDLLVEPGLSPSSLVQRTNVDRLSVLPGGTPHERATELLASDSMSRLVEYLASDDPRRIVLFDTPPLLATSESRVLAAHMGQIVLVIAADMTPQGTVAEALSTIENCPVVFTLLNRSSQSDHGRYYASYGAYSS